MTEDSQTTADNNNLEILKKSVLIAEENIKIAKEMLASLTGEELASLSAAPKKISRDAGKPVDDGKVIEGTYNGENMVGPDGKIFPVPANYASKSKLVEGDKLKLSIAEDGSFIFKQIGPVERIKIVGELKFENNFYFVEAEGKRYDILYASVTYHKAKPGDKVTIVTAAVGNPNWAALENVIHDIGTAPVTETPSDVSIPETDLAQEAPDYTEAQAKIIPETSAEPVMATPSDKEPLADSQTAPSQMPEESFLPRTQGETTNSLGEGSQAAEPTSDATELEI